MQINTIHFGLSNEYEHVVAIITMSRQPYDLAGVTSVFLDAELRQQVVLILQFPPVRFKLLKLHVASILICTQHISIRLIQIT